MIPIGIFAKTFIRTQVEDVFRAVKEHGFSLAHFNYTCAGLSAMPEQLPPTITEAIRSAAERYRIRIAGVSGTYNMIHPDPKVRQSGLRRLEVIAAGCREIGAPLISLCTGTRDPDNKWAFHPENNSRQAWMDLLHHMEQALIIAGQYDIQLGVEPELANVINSIDKAKLLLSEMGSPHLKIILDPANLFEVADQATIKDLIREAVDKLGPATAMAHAKDRDEYGHFAAPGQGIIPFDFLTETLAANGIQCPLIAHGFAEEQARQVSEYLDGISIDK